MVIIFKEYLNQLAELFKSQVKSFSFGVHDVIDIIVVAVLLYYVYKFIRDRRAAKLALGVFFIMLVKVLTDIFSLNALGFIINNFFQIGLIAIVIIFQPELRSALEQAGGTSLKSLKNFGEKHNENTAEMVETVCDAVCEMAKSKTGALIVFENQTGLNDIISSGTVINADISSFLIRNIFFENTPLHDGAVVIREGRICAAGCYLPLSNNPNIAKELGTRHRAAIGMSEVSDAYVIVVSEETGTISLTYRGEIKRNYDYVSLKQTLMNYLMPSDEDSPKIKFNKKISRSHDKSEKVKKTTRSAKKKKNSPKDEIQFDLFDGESEE